MGQDIDELLKELEGYAAKGVGINGEGDPDTLAEDDEFDPADLKFEDGDFNFDEDDPAGGILTPDVGTGGEVGSPEGMTPAPSPAPASTGLSAAPMTLEAVRAKKVPLADADQAVFANMGTAGSGGMDFQAAQASLGEDVKKGQDFLNERIRRGRGRKDTRDLNKLLEEDAMQHDPDPTSRVV